MFRIFSGQGYSVVPTKSDEDVIPLNEVDQDSREDILEGLDRDVDAHATPAQSPRRQGSARLRVLFRSNFFQILSIMLAIALGVVLITGKWAVRNRSGVTSVLYFLGYQSRTKSICRTPACVLAAAEILHSVSSPSRNIDPCTNFRDFACGGWDSRNYLSEDQARLSRRSALTDATQSLLRQILESKGPSMSTMTSEGAAKKRIFTKMQKAYRSCMNEAQIDHRGLMPLVDLAVGIRKVLAIERTSQGRFESSRINSAEFSDVCRHRD